jgi:CRISPR-associated endonuclease/helicase Cas3
MPERRSHGRSRTGVELTDELLDRTADEAAEGLDITELGRRPGRPAMGSAPAESFPVRLEPQLRGALDECAAADEKTASEIVRKALRRYLKVSRTRRGVTPAAIEVGGFESLRARKDVQVIGLST